ncbi:MAG: extracellular solute-binding protein [Ruminococcaceae bacterium]|nr:extracellular solute-binding protein [Oscillospiraceae bacterium]
MKKLRFLAVLLLVSLLAPSITACHGSRGLEQFVIPESFDDSKEYVITFWAKNDTNQTQVDIYKKAISDFEALYPNVKVKFQPYTDYGRIYNDVITNIATGTTPNVCITYPDHIATYLTGKNTVVSLDGLLTDEKFGLGGSEVRFDSPKADEIIPKFLEEGVIDGTHYAIPFMRSTEACYVNKTYVEKLGFTLPEKLTWDFMWEVAEAATVKDEDGNYVVNGQKVLIPIIYKSTDNMMIQYLAQSEAGYSTAEGEILLFNDTVKGLLEKVAVHASSGAFSTFKKDGYPANYLNAGQCIFAIDSTAGATWMGSNAPLVDISEEAIVDFETAVMEIPQVDTENPKMISQGPSVCVFNKRDSGEVLASWLFAQFLLTNEVQIAYSQTEGYAPVTSKAQNSAEYKDYLSREGEDNLMYYDIKLKATKLLLENTENTFVTPVFNGSASLRNAAGQLIEEVNKGVRRGKVVDDAYIETLYKDVSSLYRLDGMGLGDEITKPELGPLPGTAVALLSSICGAWAIIGVYVVVSYTKKRQK